MIFKNKKGVEVLPVLLLLGMITGFTVFIININHEMVTHRTNPFYGGLGERELNILGMYSSILGDLTSLDIVARHSLRTSLNENAKRVFLENNCYVKDGVPIVNVNDCNQNSNLKKVIESNKNDFSNELYRRQLVSELDFPFNYDFQIIQDGDFFTVQGYARDNVLYPIESDKFNMPGYRPRPERSSSLTFDLSRECHYIGDAQRASAVSGHPTTEFECQNRYCQGPCPKGIEPRIVPYLNQCNIPECSSGFCTIDYQTICQVGCGFKSIQMAYAFFGFEFSELNSINTDNVNLLLGDLRNAAPSFIVEHRSESNINEDANEISVAVTFSNGAIENFGVAENLRPQDYDTILEMLRDGLVRLEISSSRKNPRVDTCDNNNDKGYCINRHFVLATAGNNDYLIIHDPYTNERPYRSGMNLVVSRDFIMKYWTGHYSFITSEDGGSA